MWLTQVSILEKFLETFHIIREQMFVCGGQEDSSVVYYERQEQLFIIMY